MAQAQNPESLHGQELPTNQEQQFEKLCRNQMSVRLELLYLLVSVIGDSITVTGVCNTQHTHRKGDFVLECLARSQDLGYGQLGFHDFAGKLNYYLTWNHNHLVIKVALLGGIKLRVQGSPLFWPLR